jgi:4'-phosphopantetheinyl transferase
MAHSFPWPSYRLVPQLPLGEVHVARLSIADAAPAIPGLTELLSRDERERAAAFRFEKDRDRYVVARGGLRVMLARYLGTQPAALRFRTNRFGKPLLVGSDIRGLRFNVSHAGSVALFAFSRGCRVGVDVEKIDESLPVADLAGRLFSPSEQELWRSSPTEEQTYRFFDLWTRKEAYVKGRGHGLSISPTDFTVAMDDDGPVDDRTCSSRPGRWRTLRLAVHDGHAAAAAVEAIDPVLRCFEAVDALGHVRSNRPM